MQRILVFSCLLALGCGAPAGPGDGGSGGNDTPDAGENATPDAGNETPATTNALAVGTWSLSGNAATNCGVTFLSGMTGAAVASTTKDFTLTNKAKFNGMDMVLHCTIGAESGFTCDDYEVGMTFSGCTAVGGLKSISGHVAATGVDIEGSAWSTGGGNTCPPTVNCGPRDVSATGSVSPEMTPQP